MVARNEILCFVSVFKRIFVTTVRTYVEVEGSSYVTIEFHVYNFVKLSGSIGILMEL